MRDTEWGDGEHKSKSKSLPLSQIPFHLQPTLEKKFSTSILRSQISFGIYKLRCIHGSWFLVHNHEDTIVLWCIVAGDSSNGRWTVYPSFSTIANCCPINLHNRSSSSSLERFEVYRFEGLRFDWFLQVKGGINNLMSLVFVFSLSFKLVLIFIKLFDLNIRVLIIRRWIWTWFFTSLSFQF